MTMNAPSFADESGPSPPAVEAPSERGTVAEPSPSLPPSEAVERHESYHERQQHEQQQQQQLRRRKSSSKSRRKITSHSNNRTNNNAASASATNPSISSINTKVAREQVFLNMYLRKMRRRIHGKRSNESLWCEFLVVLILMAVIVALGWDDSDPDYEDHYWSQSDTIGLAVLLSWLVFMFAVFFVFADSGPYVKMLRIMIIYIPVLFFSASFAFYSEVRRNHEEWIVPQQYWLFALSIIAEVFVFVGYVTYYYFGPVIFQSKRFRDTPGRVSAMWSMNEVGEEEEDGWTMSYRGHNPAHGVTKCQLDYACKYEGDTDRETGLPDGLGRWLDDAWEGETLTGYWKQGEPVAPFLSWNVGTDDAVVAVRCAYFKATDDNFHKNKFVPTNKNPPEVGVASIECSVSGSFYKHLPHVTLIEGPHVAEDMPNQQHNPVRDALSHLFHFGDASEENENADHIHNDGKGVTHININACDPRGVQVLGHMYEPTGRFFSSDATSITVDIERDDAPRRQRPSVSRHPKMTKPSEKPSARWLQKTLFMPKASATNSMEKLVEVEVEDSSEEENSEEEEEEEDEVGNGNQITGQQHHKQPSDIQQHSMRNAVTLRVRNWVPYMYKEALVFFPGYNSSMEYVLKSFGQFLAMTRVSRHVYPFVYVWPSSYNLGYLYASKISASDINEENVLKMVTGLMDAGITKVNFMTHSMGVQTLLSALRDRHNEKGEFIGRSDVSMCFQMAQDFEESTENEERKHGQNSNQIVCKSITLLNPDFPVKAFCKRGFLSLRRICQTITVVGDRNDRALWWSSLINGVAAPLLGVEFTEVLKPTIIVDPEHEDMGRTLMERIGRSIDKLYLENEMGQEYHQSGNDKAFRRLLFNKAPIDLEKAASDDEGKNRFWMDMDVIDMTGLDTNIKGMRHSGFGLNPMLLRDLGELLSSGGKRAIKRSGLLYREGNVFSYAHAPSFVSQ